LEEPKFRNYRDGDESQIVALLNLAYGYWPSTEYWKQKYRDNSGFDPELIFVAEDKGQVISCVQYLRRDMKLGDQAVSAYIGGDGATNLRYTGGGIFTKLLALLYDEVRRRNGNCVYGYNNQVMYENLYRRKFGEVALHRPQVMMKVLDIDALAGSILPAANVMMKKWFSIAKGQTFTMRLDLTGQTPIDFCLRNNRIERCSITTKPDIKIRTKIEILMKMFLGGYNPLKALLFREIAISIKLGILIRALVNPRAIISAVKMRLST
jgi:predicted N-acetyltransferase YhbS/putative sterol carrier protein